MSTFLPACETNPYASSAVSAADLLGVFWNFEGHKFGNISWELRHIFLPMNSEHWWCLTLELKLANAHSSSLWSGHSWAWKSTKPQTESRCWPLLVDLAALGELLCLCLSSFILKCEYHLYHMIVRAVKSDVGAPAHSKFLMHLSTGCHGLNVVSPNS